MPRFDHYVVCTVPASMVGSWPSNIDDPVQRAVVTCARSSNGLSEDVSIGSDKDGIRDTIKLERSDARRVQHLEHGRVRRGHNKMVERHTIRHGEPNALEGMFGLNFALTMPEFPCARVMLLKFEGSINIYFSRTVICSHPHITLIFVPFFSVLAL
jgi:hypothetical protein